MEVLAQGFNPANVSTKHVFHHFEVFSEGGNLMPRAKVALSILAFAVALDKEELAKTRG